MDFQLEKHLRELGIMPLTDFDEIEAVSQSLEQHLRHMAKGYFNDPRDENGEVPF